MRLLNFFLLIPLTLFLFQGCGTKRQYFTPEKISYNIDYDGYLPAQITDVTSSGATLENGQIITNDGLQNIKLPTGYTFLGNDNNKYLATSKCGDLIIVDNNSSIMYKKKFNSCIASANIKNSELALVLSTNKMLLINTKSNKTIFSSQQDNVYALNSKIAAPYFLDTLIIYPTLDGQLLIIDSKTGKVVKNVVVGDEKFFGNVIYLGVLGNHLIAATNKRVISINIRGMNILNADVKNVIVLKNKIFVFTRDGSVILTDKNLKILKRKNFPFAVFAGVVHGKFIYMVEKGGYLIATDTNLTSTNIYKMSDAINSFLYFTKDALYYKDRYFKLSNKK